MNMKPQGTGLVELHDAKQKERGFNCMQLIAFLTESGVTEWDEWHGAHMLAATGKCPYATSCPIYAKTSKRPIQLSLF